MTMLQDLSLLLDAAGIDRDKRIFLMRASWFSVVSVHIAWTCGWLSFMGMEAPFARADDSKRIAQELREDRIESYDQRILQIRTSQCHASTPEARQQYAERLQELINRYTAIARERPRVPDCNEV